MAELRDAARPAGAGGVRRRGRPHRQLWFAEAVELIRLRRQGREQEAIRRINQGLTETRFNAFRAEHTRLLEQIEHARVARWPTTTAAACSPSTRSAPPPC